MFDRGIGVVLTPLRYVFYRIWDHDRRTRRPVEALASATFTTALFLWMNLFLVADISFVLIDGRGVFERINDADIGGFALALGVASLLAVYWSCVSGRRYEAMTDAFGGESPRSRRITGVLIWIYGFLSVATPFISAVWHRLHPKRDRGRQTRQPRAQQHDFGLAPPPP